jgi:type VI secretion system secreted protein VgrG
MAKQVNVDIELEGGTKLSHCISLVIRQEFGNPHSFEALVPFEVLEDSSESFFNKSHETVMGKVIQFSIKPSSSEDSQSFDFKGIVTSIELRNNNTFSSCFSLKGTSADGLLTDGMQRRTFVKQTLKQIFDKVLDSYPQNLLKRKVRIDDNPTLEYVVQYDESNYDFLKRLSREQGNWFYYNGLELIAGSNEDDSTDFQVDGIQNYSMSISILPSRFGVYNYNYQKDEETSGISKDQKLSGLNKLTGFALDTSENLFSQEHQIVSVNDIESGSEINNLVKKAKTMALDDYVHFNGTGENCDLPLGKIVSAKGILYNDDGSSTEENYGKYRITEIVHAVDENGCYSNSFVAIPDSLSLPPVSPDQKMPVDILKLERLWIMMILISWAG